MKSLAWTNLIQPPNGTVLPRTISLQITCPEWVAEEEAQRKALEAQGWYTTPPLKTSAS